ncbi:MAG: TlpA family protein disulfide reductase [Phycisphaeraceae bacterium]
MYHARQSIALVCLLSLACLPCAAGEFPDDWYWDRPESHTKFEGIEAPALNVGEWVGEAFDVDAMKGQIVVIDFWATWCGPCIAAMPHNSKLARKYADDGVKLIGICTSGDADKMPTILQDNKAAYPNAFAKGDQITKDWPIQWYPTYAVVDRDGIVRAIGLKPERVEDVIEALLADEDAASGKVRVRTAWLEGDAEKRARLQRLEADAAAPPALTVDNWQNSDPLQLADLKGKVVVLDFWATWSAPSEKAVAKHNALMQQHGEDGLVIIGVCSTLGGEAIKKAVNAFGIEYPVCVDIDNKTNTAYAPNGYPDYYLIDRAGTLRIADCANAMLEDAVKALLSEKLEEPAEEEKAEQ